MDRKKELENIIIGSLVNDFDEYYPSCRCSITPEMFSDDFLGKIYSIMSKMEKAGVEVNLCTLWQYPESTLNGDQLSDLCGLVVDYDFNHKKYMYNRSVELFGKSKRPKYTHVTFDDYVNKFVQMYFRRAC